MDSKLRIKVSAGFTYFISYSLFTFYLHLKEASAWRAENQIATVTSVGKVERDISTPEWVEND